MKKLLLVFCTCLLCACSSAGNNSKTCSISQEPLDVKINLTAKDDKINKLDLTIKVDADKLGFSDEFSELSDSEKETFRKNILDSLGFEEAQGVEIDTKFKDNIEMTIKIDLDKCSEKTIESLGLTDEDLSFEDSIEQFVAQGYTCK